MDFTQEDKKKIVVEAFRGVSASTRGELEFAVMENVVRILGLSRDGSLPMLLFDSEMFAARVVGYDFEPSSTRYVVRLVGKDGEEEKIRTLRTDSAAAPKILAMLEKSLGKWCAVYKHHETMKGSGGMKVRVALFIDPLDE